MNESVTTLESERRLETPSPVRRELPPVVILNMFYSGIGIARDLRGRGMRVVGLSAHSDIYGNWTRLCEVRRAPNSLEESEKLFDYLSSMAGEFEGAVIFPTRDADVFFLDRFRHELGKHYRLAIPPRDVLFRVTRKNELVLAAIRAGVAVPRTMVATTAADLDRVATEVGFPCVVKPISSVEWRAGENWERVGGHKAFRADNVEQLRSDYQRLHRISPDLLIQEMVPGPVEQIVIMGGYVGKNSAPLAYFTARKLVQSPDDFGTGCLVQSEPLADVVPLTTRLWKFLDYQGMAEVEYKLDARDGQYKLIEINTRHWDWHQLGCHSGINLSWVAYCDLVGIPLPDVQRPVQICKWVGEDVLLLHALSGLVNPGQRTPKLWRKLSGSRTYGIFAWNDPWPLCRYTLTVIFPSLVKSLVRKIRGGVSHP
jgi:predicted ATP-grasp superfamily ATP-dependent carboligase